MSNSQPVSGDSQHANFFSLSVEIRMIIYESVLVLPFTLELFQDSRGPIELFAPRKPDAWLALLYVNHRISEESRIALYGANRFFLMEVERHQPPGTFLKTFLRTIGPVNGSFLSRVGINFPATEIRHGEPEMINIREGTLQSLRFLRMKAAGLRTLELLIYNRATRRLVEEDQILKDSAQRALFEIDTELRAIPSLNTIAVKFTNSFPSPSARTFFKKLEWTVLLGDR